LAYYSLLHIVVGTNAQEGAWPWIVSIQIPWLEGMGHIYGGTLIHAQWVLTAACCFLKPCMGLCSRATNLTWPGPETQVCSIKWLLVHKHYSNITDSNNMMLLELDQPVQGGYTVQLTCMPHTSLRVSELRIC
ncbi:ACRO protein, partial [Bucorvus abyssinicus]|nr:ACRO protein [Bucorvus abyssinicus]